MGVIFWNFIHGPMKACLDTRMDLSISLEHQVMAGYIACFRWEIGLATKIQPLWPHDHYQTNFSSVTMAFPRCLRLFQSRSASPMVPPVIPIVNGLQVILMIFWCRRLFQAEISRFRGVFQSKISHKCSREACVRERERPLNICCRYIDSSPASVRSSKLSSPSWKRVRLSKQYFGG